jgi:hypothetical protein
MQGFHLFWQKKCPASITIEGLVYQSAFDKQTVDPGHILKPALLTEVLVFIITEVQILAVLGVSSPPHDYFYSFLS